MPKPLKENKPSKALKLTQVNISVGQAPGLTPAGPGVGSWLRGAGKQGGLCVEWTTPRSPVPGRPPTALARLQEAIWLLTWQTPQE